jgi:phosphoglycolate phosphatase-like HAD superfamily hydrolase
MHKTLILWDIDGTILESTGAGMEALRGALHTAFGIEGSLKGIDFAGRTDPYIIREALKRFELADTLENRERYIEGYLALLPQQMKERNAGVLPGVLTLLHEAAQRTDVVQGLLTGNLRRGAEVKLGYHGLWHYFPIGAFSDDDEVRDHLGPHALHRAREHWRHEFDVRRVWIIGDTPHDITCARAIGARVLAVATGKYSEAELAAHHPDVLRKDLSDTAGFWRALGV